MSGSMDRIIGWWWVFGLSKSKKWRQSNVCVSHFEENRRGDSQSLNVRSSLIPPHFSIPLPPAPQSDASLQVNSLRSNSSSNSPALTSTFLST